MEFDSNFMQNLERPPTRNNLSMVNIIQLILMLYLGCGAGYNLYSILSQLKFSLSNLLEILIDSLLFIGICISFYGIFVENNGYLKGGFLIFCSGCTILLIKIIIDWLKSGFSFKSLIDLLISLFIIYIIMKQIQHV